jgi:lactoylglutathione lyase
MDRRQWVQAGLALGAGVALAGCAVSPAGAPGVANGALRKIALGSCTNQTLPQPIWDTVLADRPDLVLFGGDNVYASQQPWTPAALDKAYATQAAVPSFARLRQSVRHHAIWDDHDYGLNDGGADFAHKAASKQAFMQFWQVPGSDPRQQREGLYHAEVVGPPGRRVQVILLDTRWFKSAWRPTDQRNAPGRERFVAVLGIQQIAIGGPDKQRLKSLWVDMLGPDGEEHLRQRARERRRGHLRAGQRPVHAVEVDLMQPLDPDKKPAVHTTPLNHVGLWVDDLPKAVEWMTAHGVRFAPGGIRKGAAGHDICFIHPKGNDEFPLGGEGVLIELVQAPPEVVPADRPAGSFRPIWP